MRVVRTPDGRVVLDETGRIAGRGAYLCADGACWRQAVDRGLLQRALEVPLPEELKQRLREQADRIGARDEADDRAGPSGEPGGTGVRSAATGATIDAMTGPAGAGRLHPTSEGEAVGQK